MHGAFPTALCEEVAVLLQHVPGLDEPSGVEPIRVELGGEVLHLPYRIYADAEALERTQGPSATSRRILDCLFTRHHDGRVREACVRRLLAAREPWVIPFVALLLGEYVLEIVQLIESRLDDLDVAAYRAFFAQNPALYRRTCARATSYWSCYHRAAYPERSHSPALRLLERLGP
jgi:hypothetical protein